MIVLVDVTGHDAETQALLEKIDPEFTKRQATKTVQMIQGVETSVYRVAAEGITGDSRIHRRAPKPSDCGRS